MKELSAAINKHENIHPEAAFIVAGDFNHTNLKTVVPRFHQHVSCHTRGDKTLDHVYSNLAGAYKATPLPDIGQSDHLSLFLTPRYSPLIQRVKPAVRTIKVWPEGTDAVLQDRFKNTDWNMFTHTDLDQYASSVLDYISKTTDSVTTQKRITMYPNQKPWMNRDVRLLLKARNTAFRSGDAHAYSTARANLKKGIKKAKHHYKKKVEEHFSNSNPRRMWQGLQTITDYRTTKPSPTSSDVSFLNELNNFYARFERGNPTATTKTDMTPDHQPLTLSPTDVGAVLSRISVHKAAGPDGIPGRVLRACSGELAECSQTYSICPWPTLWYRPASNPPPSSQYPKTPTHLASMTTAQ
ncbi:carcinoembryonic antigen-related cell adhesion molecule [Sarotherodon galilaeus]